MSTVVNSTEFLTRFQRLGWTASVNELVAAVLASAIPGAVIIAYLDALLAAPANLNDATISGCTAAQGAAITSFLKARGLVD